MTLEEKHTADRALERMVCRYPRGWVDETVLQSGKWTLKEETPKYAPDRTCDVVHLRLEIALDLPGRSASATATLSLRAAYGPFTTLRLDAVDLDIRSIRDGKRQALDYTYLDGRLTVRFPRPVTDHAEMKIAYRVRHPARGLYFRGPDAVEPDATWQVWSQGESEEARHWIPCHDAPNERMTTETLVTVPAELTVISNGALRGVTQRGRSRTWHFFESVPHPSYLISLAAGVFSKIEDDCDGLPVEYYVEPGREAEARRSFGKTPEMIRFFSERLQCPYPYEKYAQTAVRRFVAGGMENISATTQTEGTLHDERASLDYTSDDLVAHELAHQWFGDLLTCKSWSHAWLNEGFATYLESIWKEEDLGFAEFEQHLQEDAETYLAEPYRRSIVSNRYAFPGQVFDMHIYPKGGWVLHMLRRKLGDELFWKGIRLYVRRHASGSVETIDLIRALEEASGKSLEGFFEQWVFSPGHPELEGEISWKESSNLVEVSLKQTQKREKEKPVFHIPIRVEALLGEPGARRTGAPRFRDATGTRRQSAQIVSETFEMTLSEQTFYLALPAKPLWVLLDPDAAVLKTTKIRCPLEWSQAVLTGRSRDRRVFARIEAVQQLVEQASHRATEVLGQVMAKDPFWGVQAAAAKGLGRLRTDQALVLLIDGLKVKHPKARRAVVEALGSWQDERAVQALERLLQKTDPSYFVQMETATALGKAAGPAAFAILRKEIRSALKRRDWHDTVAAGAALGLSETREDAAVDEIFALVSDASRYWSARIHGFNALAALGAARPHLAPKIAERMASFLEDRDPLVTLRVPGAFATLRYIGGAEILRRKAEATSDPELRTACLMAAEKLLSAAERGEEVSRLHAEIEELLQETRKLRDRVNQLERRSEGARPRRRGAKSP